MSGNAVSTDLYSVDVSVSNGEFIDTTGNVTTSMHFDMLDSYATMVVRPTGTSDVMITSRAEDGMNTQTTIRVVPEARVKVQFLTSGEMQAGGDAVRTRIRIDDANGNQIQGFNSVATWSLPTGAGTFDTTTIQIKDGISDIFSYTPGSIAGTHVLTMDVAGISSQNEVSFTLLA